MSADGGPAFPGFGEVFTTDASGRTGPQSLWGMDGSTGLSLRDYFAAHAPIDWHNARAAFDRQPYNDDRAEFYALWVRLRYEWADAMLAQRERRG